MNPIERILTPAEIRAILQTASLPILSAEEGSRPWSLDVIILDDNQIVAEMLQGMVRKYYSWGQVKAFTNLSQARSYCLERETRVAIFIIDVYLENGTGFGFLESLAQEYPLAAEDTIIVAGLANDEVVERCLDLGITHLLEKPVSPYGLELAVRSVVAKYTKFLKILAEDPGLEEMVKNLG